MIHIGVAVTIPCHVAPIWRVVSEVGSHPPDEPLCVHQQS